MPDKRQQVSSLANCQHFLLSLSDKMSTVSYFLLPVSDNCQQVSRIPLNTERIQFFLYLGPYQDRDSLSGNMSVVSTTCVWQKLDRSVVFSLLTECIRVILSILVFTKTVTIFEVKVLHHFAFFLWQNVKSVYKYLWQMSVMFTT